MRVLGPALILLLLLLSWQPLLNAAATPAGQVSLGWSGVVRQTLHNTCGPALLASLLVASGEPGTELGVAQLARLGPQGVTLAEFGRLADGLGFPGAWYEAGSARPDSLPLPFVAHLDQPAGHFVLITDSSAGLIRMSAPVRGQVAVSVADFRRLWSGRAWFFSAAAG